MSPEQVKEMADAIENNQQDSPALTIDPKSNKMSVVGDPNNTHPTKGEYKITYEYYPDEVPDEDKPNLKHINEGDIDVYIAEVTYTNRRVKPLYRTKVVTTLLSILGDLDVLNEDGYTAEQLNEESGKIIINHTEEILDLAVLVLDERRERLEHARELVTFLTQLLQNEPNIINETSNFLASLGKN